jgi:hypothetical protein
MTILDKQAIKKREVMIVFIIENELGLGILHYNLTDFQLLTHRFQKMFVEIQATLTKCC